MADVVKAPASVALLALLAGAPGGNAWSMGAGAPFTPPKARQAAAAPAAGAAASGAALANDAEPVSGLNGLRNGARELALIDGAWVAPGATVRGARLVAVLPTAAQLRHPDGRLELVPLTPQVEFHRRTGAPPRSATGLARAARPTSEQP